MSLFHLSSTNRFKVIRKLGEGATGIVYEAFDEQFQERIAIKALLSMKSEALLRFKREFRRFQGVAHPNLLNMGELYEDKNRWFFTMELIEGVDLARYVAGHDFARPGIPSSLPHSFDVNRLRQSLAQLARGLIALHAAGKVHRDIKPSNVLVNASGRVVLLDYGLATDAMFPDASTVRVFGTPLYMAPEQATGQQVGRAADWYSVGVLLYEALTGQFPYEGAIDQILKERQGIVPIAPHELREDVPRDLSDVCMKLLQLDPAARADGVELMQKLAAQPSPVVPRETGRRPESARRFIGRTAEWSKLWKTFEAVRMRGQYQEVSIHGESGIGKSALVAEFTSNVRREYPKAILLSGRCHDHENIPFNAIDLIVDGLTRELAKLPHAVVEGLLPPDVHVLTEIFPVLTCVSEIALVPYSAITSNPDELKIQAFAVLRRLLVNVAREFDVVITIDDLHWADEDSISLLRSIRAGDDAPTLMVVTTTRTDDGDSIASHMDNASDSEHERIILHRFSEDESVALIESYAERIGPLKPGDRETIRREGLGHPLFMCEMLRNIEKSTNLDGDLEVKSLNGCIRERVLQLDDTTRKILEVVARAHVPVDPGVAVRGVGSDGVSAIDSIKRLRFANLIKASCSANAAGFLEPYHARISEAIAMDPSLGST